MARWLLLAWASLCSGNKFLAFHEPSHSLNEKVQVHLLNAGSESSDDAEVRQTVEDHSRRSERRIARHRSERRARNPHEPLVEITDLSLQHGLGKEADGIDIDIVKVNTNMLLPSSYSVSLVTTTEAPSSNRGNCVCSQGNFLHWSTKECVPQKPWGFECGFFPRQQQNRVCQDGLICKRLNATDLYASSGKYTGWTSTSPASCEYCTKEDDCTSGMERHLADCVRTGDLKRMEEELEDEEKDLEPWEDSEVFEAWGHKGAQLHDSDAEDLDSFGRQEPKMCVTVKVTVPALTMRDESTRLIEAKLNTTLQVIANATQKADANASASGKSRRQAVAEVQAEANASYNATAYAEATYTAYAEATDRATATYKAVATAEAKEKTKVGATDVTAAARRNGTGAATKIANATRSVKAKGEAGVLVKLNQSGHGKASAEAEEKATVHLEDVERVTKNATVTVEGHGGLKKVFQATATAKAIVEAKACISARQARKMLSEQTMKDSGKSFARAVYKKAEREAYAEAKDRATRTAVKLATEAAQKRIDQDIEHQVKDYTEAHREELEKMALEDAVNSTRDLKESLQAKAVKEAMQKAVEKVKTEAPLEAQRRADAKAKKAAEDQATKLATEEAREEAQEGLEKKAVIKAREEAQEKANEDAKAKAFAAAKAEAEEAAKEQASKAAAEAAEVLAEQKARKKAEEAAVKNAVEKASKLLVQDAEVEDTEVDKDTE